MIKTVYKTPHFKGTVLDINSMEPLPDVVVSHADFDEPTTVTDENGYFDLPAVGNLEGVLLMAGHALRIYEIKFTTPTTSTVRSVSGTMMMLNEEIVDFYFPILMDTVPPIVAPPPDKKYRTEQQLLGDITSGFLKSCNADMGETLVGLLGRARKLVQHQKQDPESEMLQHLTDIEYEGVGSYLLMYQESCNIGGVSRHETDKWFQLIQEECAARFGDVPNPMGFGDGYHRLRE